MIDYRSIKRGPVFRHTDVKSIVRWVRSVGLRPFTVVSDVPPGAIGLWHSSICAGGTGVALVGQDLKRVTMQLRPMTWFTFHAGAKAVSSGSTPVYEFARGTVTCEPEVDDKATDPNWGIITIAGFIFPDD